MIDLEVINLNELAHYQFDPLLRNCTSPYSPVYETGGGAENKHRLPAFKVVRA